MSGLGYAIRQAQHWAAPSSQALTNIAGLPPESETDFDAASWTECLEAWTSLLCIQTSVLPWQGLQHLPPVPLAKGLSTPKACP